ncbi:MutS-related protein [Flavitalea flava]
MNNIRDLHFKKEILPLFDFVSQEYSRDVLIRLLTDVPGALEEVVTRQNILKGLINHKHLFSAAPYVKSEFHETYTYLEEIRERGLGLEDSTLIVHYLFARVKREREKGRLSQLFIFLHKINQAYYASIKTDVFPPEFEAVLSRSIRTLSEMDIEKQQSIVRGRGFTTQETVRLVRKLGEKIRNGEMDVFWKDFFLFEAYLSIAKGIKKLQFSFPEFTDHKFAISDLYHPLLKNPVKNSLTIKDTVTLITGPNMSGKSTLLKALGLCVYLAHLGLAVPAEKCEMLFFDVISISINLNDDILSGYSHFMMEIKNLKSVVVEANDSKKCFAIFDELFRGTNVEDALVISGRTIEGLARFEKSVFFISTHLHQLRETLTLSDRAMTNKISTHFIECKLVDEKPVFTYKLLEGWSDLKIGQLLFEQEGLNTLLAIS